MPTRYLRLGPREQDTGSDDTSRRTEQDEEEFWPKLDKKTADRIGILKRWIYPVCRSVVTDDLLGARLRAASYLGKRPDSAKLPKSADAGRGHRARTGRTA